MTHSGTLYEKEVGAGFVVNNAKKKTVRPFLLPKASHISNIKSKKKRHYRGTIPLGEFSTVPAKNFTAIL